MDRHYDPSVGLAREELSHDFAPLRSPRPVLSGPRDRVPVVRHGRGRAPRRRGPFGAGRGAREAATECAWDPVYGGLVRGITLEDDHNDKIMADKVAWVQQEALVALRMVSVMSSDEALRGWAARFYARLHEWTERDSGAARAPRLRSVDGGRGQEGDVPRAVQLWRGRADLAKGELPPSEVLDEDGDGGERRAGGVGGGAGRRRRWRRAAAAASAAAATSKEEGGGGS